MHLQPGQTVVHPHHGPATVTGMSIRRVRGVPVAYADLRVGDLAVSVPVDRAEEIGIRSLADADALTELAEILTAPSGPAEHQWSRRIKAEREVLRTGDLQRITGLVRDLLRRHDASPLGTAEKDLLKQAASPLVAEVALSVGCDEDTALTVTRELALGRSVDVLSAIPA